MATNDVIPRDPRVKTYITLWIRNNKKFNTSVHTGLLSGPYY